MRDIPPLGVVLCLAAVANLIPFLIWLVYRWMRARKLARRRARRDNNEILPNCSEEDYDNGKDTKSDHHQRELEIGEILTADTEESGNDELEDSFHDEGPCSHCNNSQQDDSAKQAAMTFVREQERILTSSRARNESAQKQERPTSRRNQKGRNAYWSVPKRPPVSSWMKYYQQFSCILMEQWGHVLCFATRVNEVFFLKQWIDLLWKHDVERVRNN